jgi:DNA-binding MarR family transcriptional regulator
MARRLDAERVAVWQDFSLAGRRVRTDLERSLRVEHGVELALYEVLDLLEVNNGQGRMQEVADALVINRSTFTRLVDRMDSAGLVSRELTPDDGRGILLTLTAKGARMHSRARPAYRRVVQRAFNVHLTDSDLVALQRILGKVNEP